MTRQSEQRHPQEQKDRAIVERFQAEGKSDYNLAELARLRIRYRNFPGARELQADLDRFLTQWGLTEEELFDISRQLHAERIYNRNRNGEQEDWS
ncbi:DUF3288 family protein [Oscillatoria sp. FACHB-1406]|uniref:DUF3288 family protein n=1 Tax=Oscillatoria sp. FACHB-1406 TaxID=2692846 RepID=UPI001686300A|nr:DUF3288 family protein [Oscillatoria sp. FACHB-1406]